MTVRATESRLPAGFDAADLGEAAVVVGSTGSADYALVSYLASPLGTGSTVDYVVFVTNGPDVMAYDWTIEPIGTGDVTINSTEVGTFSYVPQHVGLLQVRVELNLAAGQPVVLSLLQEVRPRFTGFEFLYESGGLGAQLDPSYSVAAVGSDPAVTGELANSFRNYILSAAADHQLPPRLLGAIAYTGISDAPKDQTVGATVWTPGRDQKLEWAADELNGGGGWVTDIDDPLGVCQLTLPTLATVVGPAGLGGNAYNTWREKAADGSNASEIDDLLLSDFDALTNDQKIDLFNLARFPRTNIERCAALLAWLRDRPNRWPGLSADQLLAEPLAIETLTSELDDGPNDGTTATPQRAAGESPTTGWAGKVALHMALPTVRILFPDGLQDGASNYSARDLRRDSGGTDVTQLQDDLRELGFAIIDDPAGTFGLTTEWAVREFQIYAKSRFIAIESGNDPRYMANLAQALNLYPYDGPVSGVVNVGTRILIHLWKSKSWRCPVIVEAWDTDRATIPPGTVASRTQPAAGLGNIWRHDETPEPATEQLADSRLMFVRDFTQLYDIPAARTLDLADPDDQHDLGCHFPYSGSGGPLTSPGGTYFSRARYPSVWAEAEILPDNLVGTAFADLTPAQLATFRVVRAVSEVECLGFFDSVNCYDTAFVSMGPAHWTLGLSGPIREGELCGYLAYLAAFEAPAFHAAFERFGLRIDGRWVDDTGDRSGRDLFDADQRKYTSWVALQGEDGSYTRKYFSEDEANYFRTWHWVYRFVMAGRTVAGFRTGMWDMARIRLRDVMTTPFSAAAGIPDVPDGVGGTRTATIGDCFTSEEAAGMLLRWHIFRPFDICTQGEAGERVRAAIAAAGLPGSAGDPSNWDDNDEADLITRLAAEVANIVDPDSGNAEPQWKKDDLTLALSKVRGWPVYAGRPLGYALDPNIDPLSAARDSFKNNFDDSNLPEAPV
jgi:hypothetical protein